jgi:hypothetical protein
MELITLNKKAGRKLVLCDMSSLPINDFPKSYLDEENFLLTTVHRLSSFSLAELSDWPSQSRDLFPIGPGDCAGSYLTTGAELSDWIT